MNRELSKVIMTSSRLRNKFLKKKLKKTEGIITNNEIIVSSIVSEVIKTILTFLFIYLFIYFFMKRFYMHKKQ